MNVGVKLYIQQHSCPWERVREKHACTQCDAIVQAPTPSRPIEWGIAGPELLARVLTSKYAEHTPLYRQSEYTAARVWS